MSVGALATGSASVDTPNRETLGLRGAAALGSGWELGALVLGTLAPSVGLGVVRGTMCFFFFPLPTDMGTKRGAAGFGTCCGADAGFVSSTGVSTFVSVFVSVFGGGRLSMALKSSFFIGSFLIGLPVSSYSSVSTLGSLLNAGSAPVFRLMPEASPLPNPLLPVFALSDADIAFRFGFFGAGNIALKPPKDEPPPRRGFFAGGASSCISSFSCRGCDAPGRLTLIRPGFERSTTFWKPGFGAGFAAIFGAGDASLSDSESE